MNDDFLQKKEDALCVLDRLVPLVFDAEKRLSHAWNWSFIDVLGGGFFVDIFKYLNIGRAKNSMDEVDRLLRELSSILGGMEIPVDYRMQLGGFATFADFVFDGFIISDVYRAGKILASLDQVNELKRRLVALQVQLQSM